MTTSFLDELEELEPFGNGNPRPVFCSRGLYLKWAPKIVGNNHLKLWFADGDRVVEGIAFSKGHLISEIRDKDMPYDIVFVPRVNYYRGEASVQLFIRDIKASVKP
jgi:single-stranded-DNA-specific exonuclease